MVLCLGLFFAVPDWIQNAKITQVKTWYPVFGTAFYISWHFLLPIFFCLAVFVLFFLWKGNIVCGVNTIKGVCVKYAKKLLYVCFFSFLLGQFYYNYNNPEVYPAVMMPLFGKGKYTDSLTFFKDEIIVQNCSEKVYILTFYDLTIGMIGDEESKQIAARKIIYMEPDAELKDYLYTRCAVVTGQECIEKITLVKITDWYVYDGNGFGLKNTEREVLYKFAYK